MPKSIVFLKVLLKDQRQAIRTLMRLSLSEQKSILAGDLNKISDHIHKKKKLINSIRSRSAEITLTLKQLKSKLVTPQNLQDRIHASECKTLFNDIQKSAIALSNINKQNMRHIIDQATASSSKLKSLAEEESNQNINIETLFENQN